MQEFDALVERRIRGEPIAYLVGSREFFGRTFKITPAVLIPRPETELLVEIALEKIPEKGRVLDLGTGCGNIAIALAAHRPLAKITAVDISEAALQIARENLRALFIPFPTLPLGPHPRPLSTKWRGVARDSPYPVFGGRDGGEGGRGWGGVRFIRSDWFSRVENEKFDVIVANPPYVAEHDPHLYQGDLRFEPRSALISGKDGLAAIRRIAAEAPVHLAYGGWLLIEHGFDQSQACAELLHEQGFQELVTAKDLAGIPRVAGGRLTRRAGNS